MTNLPDLLTPIDLKLDDLLLDSNNPRFSELGEQLSPIPEGRFADDKVQAAPAADRLAHVGVHAQKQEGLVWIGVATPVGRITCTQMHALADLASTYGDGAAP